MCIFVESYGFSWFLDKLVKYISAGSYPTNNYTIIRKKITICPKDTFKIGWCLQANAWCWCSFATNDVEWHKVIKYPELLWNPWIKGYDNENGLWERFLHSGIMWALLVNVFCFKFRDNLLTFYTFPFW